MIYKARGIVFRFTKFRETSIIVTIFTDTFGLQSYIVNGVRSKTSRNRIALYQPLTLVNMVVYHRENANIERIKEISCLHPYATLMTDHKKSAVAMFLTELLNKVIREESHAADMFDFISTSLITLDTLQSGYENFHLVFMLKLCRFLGFGARSASEVTTGPESDKTVALIESLLRADYGEKLRITNEQRRLILDIILKFYTDHMGTLTQMKSLAVLREVLG